MREVDEALGPSFSISQPLAGAPASPLIFASPHSGRIYPQQMMAATKLSAAAIRQSEDAYMDRLIEGAALLGVPVITARFARVFFDVNREPWELDPGMFADELPAYARVRTARVAAGLGAIARIVSEGQEVYARKLSFAEAEARVEAVHRPYHSALKGLIDSARRDFGVAILIDWHSMPAEAARGPTGGPCDVVLGDRFGGSCAPALSRQVERHLQKQGYVVTRNAPYAGGYTTEHYGRPGRGVHALQVEVNRALYLDEAQTRLNGNFDRLKVDLEDLFAGLVRADWSRL